MKLSLRTMYVVVQHAWLAAMMNHMDCLEYGAMSGG